MSRVVEHLAGLVRLASVSRLSNRPVIEYAKQVLHAVGWTTHAYTYRDGAGVEKINLVAAPAGQDVTAKMMALAFFCHTDTVPFAAGWAHALDPFVEDGMLYGCGACDVKGFLACLLVAAEENAGQCKDGLRIVLTADEEVGCVGAARLIADDVIRARQVVVGEPTGLQVARAGKGYCVAEVTVRGREAHSAHPAQGASAIHAAAAMILRLESYAADLERHRNELFSPAFTTLHVGTIVGGSAKNILAGECKFVVEWRPVPHPAAAAIAVTIGQLIQAEASLRPGIVVEVNVLRQQQGFETSAEADLVQELQAATGLGAGSIPFGSEASLFASRSEEIVVFGPGDMRVAHSERECVAIAELDAAVLIIERLMRGERLNGTGRP